MSYALTCPGLRSRIGEDLVDQPSSGPQVNQRRTDASRVFPNPAVVLRLAGAVFVEAHGESQVSAERGYLSGRSLALLAESKTVEVAKPEHVRS